MCQDSLVVLFSSLAQAYSELAQAPNNSQDLSIYMMLHLRCSWLHVYQPHHAHSTNCPSLCISAGETLLP